MKQTSISVGDGSATIKFITSRVQHVLSAVGGEGIGVAGERANDDSINAGGVQGNAIISGVADDRGSDRLEWQTDRCINLETLCEK